MLRGKVAAQRREQKKEPQNKQQKKKIFRGPAYGVINGVWIKSVNQSGKKSRRFSEKLFAQQENGHAACRAQEQADDFRRQSPVERQIKEQTPEERKQGRPRKIRMKRMITVFSRRIRLIPAVCGYGKTVAVVKLFGYIPVFHAVICIELIGIFLKSPDARRHPQKNDGGKKAPEKRRIVFRRQKDISQKSVQHISHTPWNKTCFISILCARKMIIPPIVFPGGPEQTRTGENIFPWKCRTLHTNQKDGRKRLFKLTLSKFSLMHFRII